MLDEPVSVSLFSFGPLVQFGITIRSIMIPVYISIIQPTQMWGAMSASQPAAVVDNVNVSWWVVGHGLFRVAKPSMLKAICYCQRLNSIPGIRQHAECQDQVNSVIKFRASPFPTKQVELTGRQGGGGALSWNGTKVQDCDDNFLARKCTHTKKEKRQCTWTLNFIMKINFIRPKICYCC